MERLTGTLFFAETTLCILDSLFEDGIIRDDNEIYQTEKTKQVIDVAISKNRSEYMTIAGMQYILTDYGELFRVFDKDLLSKVPRKQGYRVSFKVLKKKRGKWRWAKNIELL